MTHVQLCKIPACGEYISGATTIIDDILEKVYGYPLFYR